jgi:hypothetical protein
MNKPECARILPKKASRASSKASLSRTPQQNRRYKKHLPDFEPVGSMEQKPPLTVEEAKKMREDILKKLHEIENKKLREAKQAIHIGKAHIEDVIKHDLEKQESNKAIEEYIINGVFSLKVWILRISQDFKKKRHEMEYDYYKREYETVKELSETEFITTSDDYTVLSLHLQVIERIHKQIDNMITRLNNNRIFIDSYIKRAYNAATKPCKGGKTKKRINKRRNKSKRRKTRVKLGRGGGDDDDDELNKYPFLDGNRYKKKPTKKPPIKVNMNYAPWEKGFRVPVDDPYADGPYLDPEGRVISKEYDTRRMPTGANVKLMEAYKEVEEDIKHLKKI